MENLKEKFKKLQLKYKSKLPYFEKVISKWTGKKQKEALALLDQLKQESKQISELLSENVSVAKQKDLKQRLKNFKKIYKSLNESTKPILRQWVEALVVAAVVVFFLRNFFFAFYHVPSGSAEVNILVGDRILGNNMIYKLGVKPKHGDFVMFLNPEFKFDRQNKFKFFWQKYIGLAVPLLGISGGPDNFVKRVIGVPGDTVEGRVEDGKTVVYLNGEKLDEPYVNPYPLIGLKKIKGFIDFDRIGPFSVPDFLRKQMDIMFYSYDPDKKYSDQPFYHMTPEQVILKPGTLQRWIKHSYTPTYNQFGKVVDDFGPIILPKGKYWVMGDSRKNSQDSRFWGLLDEDLIYGRASFVFYSIDSIEPFWLFEFMKHPISFWKRIRYNRFFKNLS